MSTLEAQAWPQVNNPMHQDGLVLLLLMQSRGACVFALAQMARPCTTHVQNISLNKADQ
jgi:hypothetical protein